MISKSMKTEPELRVDTFAITDEKMRREDSSKAVESDGGDRMSGVVPFQNVPKDRGSTYPMLQSNLQVYSRNRRLFCVHNSLPLQERAITATF